MRKVLIILLVSYVVSLMSIQVSPDDAKIFAENFLTEKVVNSDFESKSDINLELLQDKLFENLYFLNNTKSKGFVIISNNYSAYPLIGYSTEINFSFEDLPPAFEQFLVNSNKQINEINQKNLIQNNIIKEEWDYYLNYSVDIKRDRSQLGPLVTSLWDQGRFYNEFCPEDEDGIDGRCWVGCVATAMAQIMDYFEYPLQGTGEGGYYMIDENEEPWEYGQLYANFGESTYNWENIPDVLTDYSFDTAQLNYHCGIAVIMGYGPNGSGADSDRWEDELPEHFSYSNAINIKRRFQYNDDEWVTMIKENLDKRMPIHYTGSNDHSGHAFVCDGYDGDLLHFNWGWAGRFNGYFNVANLNPGTSTYSDGQSAILDIYPNVAPVAQIGVNATTIQVGSPLNFFDESQYRPNQWSWEFPGSNTPTSNEENPQNITYAAPGEYSVTLTVSNEYSSDTITNEMLIQVVSDLSPVADFSFSEDVISSNQSVIFSDLSLNSPTSWQWNFTPNSIEYINGTNELSQNPEVIFLDNTDYSVELTAQNTTDSNSILKENIIHVGGTSLPFFEDFEYPLCTTDWIVKNPDEWITWDYSYYNEGNPEGFKSVRMKLFSYEQTMEVDSLISPLMNFADQDDITLSFWYAYANRSEMRLDELHVLISNDNGETWDLLESFSSLITPGFETHEPLDESFYPMNEEDWCSDYAINLDDYAGQSNIRICFKTVNDHGNSLYLDKIKVVSGTTSTNDPIINKPQILSSYPNPFNPNLSSRQNSVTIQYSINEPSSDVTLSIFNILGQKVKEINEGKREKGLWSVNWDAKNEKGYDVPSGIYLYKLSTGSKSIQNKMLIVK